VQKVATDCLAKKGVATLSVPIHRFFV
jgi:hypothetical protein